MRTLPLLVVCCCAAVAVSSAQTPPASRPAVKAHAAAEAPVIDGQLNEVAWRLADSVTTFTQTDPSEGSPGSGRTIVRVLTTRDALYIGIVAVSPPSVPIVAYARDRDASLSSEDHVKIVIDSYLDGRSGYVFAVNPNGARYDALVVSQGESESADWDAVWEAEASRGPDSWSAELRIPVKSLLFRDGLTEWGFNIQRRIQGLQETQRWASPLRHFQITHVRQAGILSGIPRFELGMGLSVRPSATTGMSTAAPGAATKGTADASLDATQRVTPNTLASLTVNTDFAESEVDTRRTNLTRFPLLFPEKRTFFLEGSDVFDFGLGTGSDVRPFFSRRIGLISGNEVPLYAGLKVNGRERGTNFGALVVRTGLSDAPPLDTLPTSNTLAAVRVSKNVLRESSVGFVTTAGDPLGRSGSWLAGPDVTYQTSRFLGNKNFLIGGWVLGTRREDISGTSKSFGGKIDYPNSLLDMALTYKWIDADFQPSLGFVPRTAAQIINFNVTHQPNPKKPVLGLPVQTITNEFLNTFVLDLDGEWESYRVFLAPVNWRLRSGDRIELNVVPVGERLVAPFAIADGVTIPAGSYHWRRYRAETQFASKRRFSGQATWWFGDFYTGTLHELTGTAAFRPSPLIAVEMNATRNIGRLPEGNFTQQVIGTRVRYNVSSNLQFNSYLQYDDQSDSFGTNSRMRWTISPSSELFVVYNHNLDDRLDPLTLRRDWRFSSNQLIVKAQRTFRY